MSVDFNITFDELQRAISGEYGEEADIAPVSYPSENFKPAHKHTISAAETIIHHTVRIPRKIGDKIYARLTNKQVWHILHQSVIHPIPAGGQTKPKLSGAGSVLGGEARIERETTIPKRIVVANDTKSATTMVETKGFEPSTSRMRTERSPEWSAARAPMLISQTVIGVISI